MQEVLIAVAVGGFLFLVIAGVGTAYLLGAFGSGLPKAQARANSQLVGRWKPLEVTHNEKTKSMDSIVSSLQINDVGVWSFELTERGHDMLSAKYQAKYSDGDRVELVPSDSKEATLSGTVKITGGNKLTLTVERAAMPGQPVEQDLHTSFSFSR